MKFIFKLIGLFVELAQACRADFGAQDGLTFRANGDLTGFQYRCVRGDGSGLTNLCSETAVTSLGPRQYLGVLQNKPRSGEMATVAFAGLSKVVTGAAVQANGWLTHNASGQAIDAVSGSIVIGRALESTGAAGEIGTVMLFPPSRWGAIL